MLTTKKTINITGESVIDGVTVERYTAVINESNPENMVLNQVQIKKSLAKENRDVCRADRAEFEDLAYSLQDEMTTDEEDEVVEE